jgi:hypothetical protein
MPFDGSGNYNVPAGTTAVTATVIDSTRYNALLADLQAALTGSVRRNGESALTANFLAGGFRLTNVANAVSAQDAATKSQVDEKLTASLVSSFMLTLLNDADAATAQQTLGGTTLGRSLFTVADAPAARTAIGAAPAATSVSTSRLVSAGGLATGGGDLTTDRAITVSAASQAQAEAGTDTATVMTPQRTEQHMQANALGWGQTWTDVDASRTTGTTYQNSTTRPILVCLRWRSDSGTGRNFQVSLNGTDWTTVNTSGSSTSDITHISVIIPVDVYYRVDGALGIKQWTELR